MQLKLIYWYIKFELFNRKIISFLFVFWFILISGFYYTVIIFNVLVFMTCLHKKD